MKNFISFFILTFFLMLTGCLETNNKDEAVQNDKIFKLVYSHDVNGELEPCGCKKNPLGGLAKMATILDSLKQIQDLLVVDAGNLLFKSQNMTSVQEEEWILKAELLMQTQKKFGLDAINVGIKDLTNGLKFLQDKSKAFEVPYISSNVVGVDSKKLAFEKYIIKNVSGIKVGIFGVTQGITPKPSGVDWDVLDFATSAKETAKELKSKGCEIIIILADVSKQPFEKMITSMQEVDFAVLGHDQYRVNPEVVGQTTILRTRDRGRAIGTLEIGTGSNNSKPIFTNVTTTKRAYDQTLKRLEKASDNLKTNIQKGLESTKKKLEEETQNNYYAFELIDLSTSVADREDIRAEIDAVTLKVAEISRNKRALHNADYPSDPNRIFVGEKSCKECHTKQYKFWLETGHSRAYAILERENKQFSVDCVGCHVTGWEEEGGFYQPKEVGNLKNVQCESCHGPGKFHIEAELKNRKKTIRRIPDEKKCLKCHTDEQTDGFNYPVFIEIVSCPAGK